jgi:O-antigen ligase
LDNQYLLLLIECGIVGLSALLAVLVAAVLCARSARNSALSAADRAMGQSIIAAIIAGATLFAFFDALSFPKAGGTMFLVVGLAGGFWRFMETAGDFRNPTSLIGPQFTPPR